MADVAASTLEAIARYAPDIDVPPPAVLDQARRNLELQVALLREFGAISAREQPDPVARPALAKLAAQGFSDWQAAVWWSVPSAALDGRRPVDVLLGRVRPW